MSERDIFIAALQNENPAERSTYLEQACAHDPGLRRRIEVLLQAHEQAGSFLEKPPGDAGVTGNYVANPGSAGIAEPATETPGTRIGPYKLLQQIAEGGMGVVWMAEQEQPLRRQVALKVIKPGMDSGQVLARFEAERQALALMDHPNIARVLDAGTTPGGRPYFVMELVKGIPITTYCDEHHLTPRERLQLFLPVCQAVQHAHQKGIIHRDLKPSNVLVASYDSKPVPKVIDFGVAKATGQQLTARTLFTGFGAIVGTLEYMSPEQAEFNSLDIDTRSDIYSLGVLLYELLTGTTPLTREQLKDAAFGEALRLIREVDPPRPSTRLSEEATTLASISAQRRTQPAQLPRLVRRELDWLVMKALDKDRNRRYATAAGLARDIERYLADEAVEACPPSPVYRLQKFARKHRTGLVTALAFALLLLGGAVTSSFLAVRAGRAEMMARAQAEAAVAAEAHARAAAENAHTMVEFVIGDMTGLVNVRIGDDGKLDDDSRDELLHVLTKAKGVAGRFQEQPAVEWKFRGLIGMGYYFLQDYRAAQEQAERVLVLLRQLHGDDHPETVKVVIVLAGTHRELKQFAQAEALLQKELDILLRAPDEAKDRQALDVVVELARLYRDQGTPEKYPLLANKISDRCRQRHPSQPLEYAAKLEKVANYLLSGLFFDFDDRREEPLRSAHRRALGELMLRQAYDFRRQMFPDDWKTFRTQAWLGNKLLQQKKYAEAEPLLVQGYEGMKAREAKILPADNWQLTSTANDLARLYDGWGKKDKADEWRNKLKPR